MTVLHDLRWDGSLTATFNDGMVTTWDVPQPGAAALIERTVRILTTEERHRFGLPPHQEN